MLNTRILVPALLLLAAVPVVSEAQTSVPLTTTTYQVQVKYEYWRSGVSYWSTVLETEDRGDAELMHDLLLIALENGSICDVLDCSFDMIVNDVRLVSKTTFNYQFNDQLSFWADYRFFVPRTNWLQRGK